MECINKAIFVRASIDFELVRWIHYALYVLVPRSRLNMICFTASMIELPDLVPTLDLCPTTLEPEVWWIGISRRSTLTLASQPFAKLLAVKRMDPCHSVDHLESCE